ncbi:hypothetical protein [Burkholderia ubonensis]|uniref:hypothetical protein n=1 Tax=Burkholderia ubonensis TaxID=101571 RepID=UPI000A54B9F8|nr:hypothetical protein [Burkholderia ubonensis]
MSVAVLRKHGDEFARRTNREAATHYSGCMEERSGQPIAIDSIDADETRDATMRNNR